MRNVIYFVVLNFLVTVTFGQQCPRCERLDADKKLLQHSWRNLEHCWWFPTSYRNLDQYALALKVDSISMTRERYCRGKVILPGDPTRGSCAYKPGTCILYTTCTNKARVQTALRSAGCNAVYSYDQDNFQCQKITLTSMDTTTLKSFSMRYTYFKCVGEAPDFTSPKKISAGTATTTTTTPTTTTTTTTPTTTTTTTTPTTTTTTTTPTTTTTTTTIPRTTTTMITIKRSRETAPNGASSRTVMTSQKATTTLSSKEPAANTATITSKQNSDDINWIMGRASNNNGTKPDCEVEDADTVPGYFLYIVIAESVLLGLAVMVIIAMQCKK